MWNWTKMGARVIVTPGEMTPAQFSHPLLVAQKVVPQPVIANEPAVDAPLGSKSRQGRRRRTGDQAATDLAHAETSLELRSTVGVTTAPLRDRTQTADASGAMPATNAVVTMSRRNAVRSDRTAACQAMTPQPPDEPSRIRRRPQRPRSSAETKAEASAEAKPDAANAEAPTAAIVKVEAIRNRPKPDLLKAKAY